MADVERAVRGIPRREIQKALGKTERINILVTPRQREEIRVAAMRYGLSMTDYLLRLHALVEARLRGKREIGRRAGGVPQA